MSHRKTLLVPAAVLLICAALLFPVSPAYALPAAEANPAVQPPAEVTPPPETSIVPVVPPADDPLLAQLPPGHPPFPPVPPVPPFPPVPPMPPAPPHPIPPYPYPYPYPHPSPDPYGPGIWPYCDGCRWYVNPRPITQVVVVQVPQQPICPPVQCSAPVIVSFTAVPNCVQSCQSSTLSWTVTNATSVSIYPMVGSVGSSGSYVVTPANTTTYTLTASNSYGSVTASTTVTVNPVVTSYSTSTSPTTTPVSSTTTSVVTSGLSSGSNPFSNLWLMSLLLIGLLAIAAVATVLIITRRRAFAPAAAAAGTVAGFRSSGTAAATRPATGTTPRTTSALTALQAKFVSSKGDMILLPATGYLGRSDFQSVLPADKADRISRQHIEVVKDNGQHYIEDRNSTNGTRLNGQAIKGTGRRPLNDGDTVELAGAISLIFQT